jgi:hypothetical protein
MQSGHSPNYSLVKLPAIFILTIYYLLSSFPRNGKLKANSNTHTMPFPCRAHAVPIPCRAFKSIDCVFPIWFRQCGLAWFTHAMPRPYHATTMPFWKRLLKTTAQRGMGMACHVWISIGRPEMACGRPSGVRLLQATTRSSTKFVIKSIPVLWTVELAVQIFPATMRAFTKDTTLSENGWGAAWHV